LAANSEAQNSRRPNGILLGRGAKEFIELSSPGLTAELEKLQREPLHGSAFAGHAARFGGPDFVERFVHFGYDMEAVEDMKCLGAFFAKCAH
jgi:hypothetical protein